MGIGLITCEEKNSKRMNCKRTVEGPLYFMITLMDYEFSIYLRVFLVFWGNMSNIYVYCVARKITASPLLEIYETTDDQWRNLRHW